MERKTISIEPYIKSGGILGTRIEVNPKAANSVMKRTALRRNVVVTRGYERDQFNAVGSDELAIVKSKTEFGSAEKSKSAKLKRFANRWIVNVNDQKIVDDVEEWMKSEYRSKPNKNGHKTFEGKFAEGLNTEITTSLRTAFFSEKKEFLVSSVTRSSKSMVGSAGLFAVGYIGGKFLLEHDLNDGTDASGAELLVVFGEVLAVTFGLGAYIQFMTKDLSRSYDPNLKTWEYRFPNPQIPSLVLGSAAVAMNGSKLIRLSDSK